jgi:hypothetical protein
MGYDVRYTNDVQHLDNNQPLLDAAAAAVTPTVTSGRPQTVSVQLYAILCMRGARVKRIPSSLSEGHSLM